MSTVCWHFYSSFDVQHMKSISKSISLAFAILFLASSCATLTDDIVISTRSNSEINYDKYKTYAWAGNTQIVFDPIGQWEQPTLDTDEEVRFVVNRELRNLGINQVKEDPDILVTCAAGIDMTSMKLKADPDSDAPALSNVPRAALAIALVDTKTGYTVWVGFAEGEVQQQQSIENIRKRIDYAIHEIFKNYND
ncbi:MAG TPA: DUF4136 domain-containing protein [Gammaproteobacteria bacterium]|nr:DUF4136 domain-containing protein [Gammaproteobacteria bacterium]